MSKNTMYLKDKTLEQDQKRATRNKIIIGSAVVAGSIFAYNSGAMKSLVGSGISILERSKGAIATGSGFINWFNGEGAEGTNSLIRTSIKDTAKNILNMKINGDDLNVSLNKDYIKKMMTDTKSDFSDMKQQIALAKAATEKTHGQGLLKSIFNTELSTSINDANKASQFYSSNHRRAKDVINYKTRSNILDKNILSDEEAQKQLKKLGIKNLVIEDIFDFDTKSYGDGRVKLAIKAGVKTSKYGTDSEMTKLRNQIEGMLNTKAFSDDGVRLMNTARNTGMFLHETNKNFGRLKLDSSLFVNSSGSLQDLRGMKSGLQKGIRSLANNWKIPIININPLKMVGLGNVGLGRTLDYATISERSVAPFLTGVRGGGKDNTIANLKGTVGHLKGVREGVTIIDGDVFRINDTGDGITKMAFNTKKKVSYISAYGSGNFNYGGKLDGYMREMAGVGRNSYTNHTGPEGNKFWRKVMNKLDIGYQENDRKVFNNAGDYLNPDNYIRAVARKVVPKAWNTKASTKNLYGFTNPDYDGGFGGSFFVSNKSISLKDVFKNFDASRVNKSNLSFNALRKNGFSEYMRNVASEAKNISVNQGGLMNAGTGYVRQHFGEFSTKNNSWEYVNKRSGLVYSMLRQTNDKLSNVGLGLGSRSTTGTWGLAKNLLLKRALPAYALYRGWDMLNMFGEKDRSGPSTLNQLMAEQMVQLDVGFHVMGEKLGINKLASNVSSMMPGSDKLARNLGLERLGINQSADERMDYWQNGYDAVRKKRGWLLSSDPMGGTSIEYYRANAYRRALADVKYSEQGYGSRLERLANTFNLYHYDKKHYNDRPYLQTSGVLGDVPIAGELLQNTIGKIIKPTRKMHSEYWKGIGNFKPLTPNDVLKKETRGMSYIQSLNKASQYGRVRDSMSRHYDLLSAQSIRGYKIGGTATADMMYRTASGTLQGVRVASSYAKEASRRIRFEKQSLSNIGLKAGGSTNQILGSPISKEMVKNYQMGKISRPGFSASQFKRNTGMYGFMADMAFGGSGRKKTVIQSSNYRSTRKTFDDMRLGGMGGDFNLLARRTLQGQRNDQIHYNPIRNSQAEWMPGRNGVIDFQHGDSYSKIANGLERLAGEGYERLNNINFKETLELGVDVDYIGKSKEDLIRHWTYQDLETGERAHIDNSRNGAINTKIKKDMIASGAAVASDVEIGGTDKVYGTYDLAIRDSQSRNGLGVMNVRTVSDSEFKRINRTGIGRGSDIRSINYAAGHAGTDRGHIMYVNQADPRQSKTVNVKYNENMYQQSMRDLQTARNNVIRNLNNGNLKRGDLYSHIDRLRILADTAPFSDEYANMSSQISQLKLKPGEQEEVRRIRERVKKQKASYDNFTPYKFRDKKVSSSITSVTRHMGRGSFALRNFDDAVKLSGIDMITTDNPKYAEAQEFLRKNVENNIVKVLVDKDQKQRRNKDMQDSVKAVIYANGMNINKEMVKRGYATWKEGDNSATATYARYNKAQRAFGRAWERFAHMDTLAHSKLLNVRSAAEAYKDDLYGKKNKSWKRPVKDYVKPFLLKNSQRGLLGVAIGGFVGSLFATKAGGRFGKFAGSVIGAGLVAGTQAYTRGSMIKNKKGAYIPKEKQTARDINEYMDKLKYIKNRRLFEMYAAKAMKDKVDVRRILNRSKISGYSDKGRKNALKRLKASYARDGSFRWKDLRRAKIRTKLKEKFIPRLIGAVKDTYFKGINRRDITNKNGTLNGKKFISSILGIGTGVGNNLFDNLERRTKKRNDYLINRINNSDTLIKNRRSLEKTSQNAIKAIEYYNAANKTMHAFQAGDNIKDAMDAMPKKDRAYFKAFMDASNREKKQIMKYAPDYMKRQLHAAWGQKVDERQSLKDYFSTHAMPDSNWKGWREDYDLNSIKAKIAITNNVDLQEVDLHEEDRQRAEMYGHTDIPNIHYREKNTQAIKKNLENVLLSNNFENINIDVKWYNRQRPGLNMAIEQNKEDKYRKEFDKRMRDLR